MIASGWCTVTLVYSQVLSVPAGDGGLHVQQAPRVGYSGLSEFLCKQFDPALRTDSSLVWITLRLNIVSLYMDIMNNIFSNVLKVEILFKVIVYMNVGPIIGFATSIHHF